MEIRHILFETERFNISEVKDHFINPCCFGEDLADWLKARLNAKGLKSGEPYQEDWGWEFSLMDNFGAYYIGVGGNPAEPAASKITPSGESWSQSAARFGIVSQARTG